MNTKNTVAALDAIQSNLNPARPYIASHPRPKTRQPATHPAAQTDRPAARNRYPARRARLEK